MQIPLAAAVTYLSQKPCASRRVIATRYDVPCSVKPRRPARPTRFLYSATEYGEITWMGKPRDNHRRWGGINAHRKRFGCYNHAQP